jgi:outer membrane immunogenic protein
MGLAAPAWSADLVPPPAPYPVKGVPYVAPIYDWSGFYAGAHGGYGLFRGSADNIGGSGINTSLSGDGWLAGVQLGYNYQLGSWVFGVEGDWSYTDIRGTNSAPALEQTVRIDWVGTVTGRAGIAWDRTLLYLKGGVAFANVRSEALVPATILLVGNDNRMGWTIGAGVEWGWTGNWTVKAEYDYLDLGTRTVTLTSSSTGLSTTEDSNATAHMIKLGANYRFNWR